MDDRRKSSDFKLLHSKRKFNALEDLHQSCLTEICKLKTELVLNEIQKISFNNRIQQQSNNEKICSVCYLIPENWSVYTTCGHTYCRTCIRSNLITSCPSCRNHNLTFIDIY